MQCTVDIDNTNNVTCIYSDPECKNASRSVRFQIADDVYIAICCHTQSLKIHTAHWKIELTWISPDGATAPSGCVHCAPRRMALSGSRVGDRWFWHGMLMLIAASERVRKVSRSYYTWIRKEVSFINLKWQIYTYQYLVQRLKHFYKRYVFFITTLPFTPNGIRFGG